MFVCVRKCVSAVYVYLLLINTSHREVETRTDSISIWISIIWYQALMSSILVEYIPCDDILTKENILTFFRQTVIA